jgi:hypothetical protein
MSYSLGVPVCVPTTRKSQDANIPILMELLDKIRDHSDEVANAAGDNLAVFFR